MACKRLYLMATGALGALTLGGCASFPTFTAQPSFKDQALSGTLSPSTGSSLRERPRHIEPELLTLPKAIAKPVGPTETEANAEQIRALVGTGLVSATLPPQPIPQFLDTAFGDVLKIPYAMGPNVGGRTEVISVGGANGLARADFFRLVQTALRTYGLKVYIRGAQVSIIDDNVPISQRTAILRSRSAADTPEDARTVIQFYQLATLEALSVLPLVQDLLPQGHSVKVTADPLSNTLILTGSGRDVAAAVSALHSFDQPNFAGAKFARFEPAFWSADGFAKALRDALSTEGYKLADTLLASRSIMIVPMNANGQVLVFAADQQLMDRVLFWATQLDRAATIGDQKSTFIYTVRNTDASSLVGLVTGSGTQQQNTVQPPVGVPGTPPASASASPQTAVGAGGTVPGGGTIASDPIGNRLIFSGTAAQFAQVRSLLEQLDVAPAQVLVEVTIAEVTLTDSSRAGLEVFFKNSLGGTSSISGGTQGGLGIGSSGFNLTYVGANMNVAFNAFASNNKVNILSRPRLMARSGTDAELQVGSDIPIITSQQASSVQTGGNTSVLQSVSYRQTGIILKLKPVVYGDRVDMTISQEVSSQQANGNAAISSPVILNRSVMTQLSVPDGATGVISGLIDNSYSKGNEGIPFAKDVPILGQLFRTDTVDGSKTDLLVLVTPHIVRTDDDIANLTDRLSGEINNSFRVGRGSSYTLTSFATGQNVGIAVPPVRQVDVLTKSLSPAVSVAPASQPVQP